MKKPPEKQSGQQDDDALKFPFNDKKEVRCTSILENGWVCNMLLVRGEIGPGTNLEVKCPRCRVKRRIIRLS